MTKYKKVLTKIEEVKMETFKRLQETSRCRERNERWGRAKELQVTTAETEVAEAAGLPRQGPEASPTPRQPCTMEDESEMGAKQNDWGPKCGTVWSEKTYPRKIKWEMEGPSLKELNHLEEIRR